MRYSKLFSKTLKEIPAEAESISHQLLVRSGMIQQIGTGVYAYMPLGWRVLNKIEDIVRDEMDKAGGQELMMPSVQPLEFWDKSGRSTSFGKILFTLKDRKEHEYVLGPTHEEVISELAHRLIQSYRDLPLMPYQIQNKFRDEPRPRGGLLRAREFIMKDLYSFDMDPEALDISYQKMVRAYRNIFRRCGLSSILVEADSGAIGGKESGEFMLFTDTGEDKVVFCQSCDYAANLEKAVSIKKEVENAAPLAIEEVHTPNIKTIEEVAAFLKVPENRTLKAVFYAADNELIFVVIRGDIEVNEIKLKNLLKCADLRMATDAEVESAGLVAGAASPVGLKRFKILADESVKMGSNFIAGGNKKDIHIKNVNYPRDFKADIIADISTVSPEDTCVKCKGKLQFKNGVEVGHVFKLGTFLSEKFGVYYLDKEGASRPAYMGCYGIGIGRLLAAAVEQSHDEKGIIWPMAIAPFQIHICALKMDDKNVFDAAEKLYTDLTAGGFEVLYDDRDESAGKKFNDADLIGIPVRLTVSPRTLQNGNVEVKLRNEKDVKLFSIDDIAVKLKELIKVD